MVLHLGHASGFINSLRPPEDSVGSLSFINTTKSTDLPHTLAFQPHSQMPPQDIRETQEQGIFATTEVLCEIKIAAALLNCKTTDQEKKNQIRNGKYSIKSPIRGVLGQRKPTAIFIPTEIRQKL